MFSNNNNLSTIFNLEQTEKNVRPNILIPNILVSLQISVRGIKEYEPRLQQLLEVLFNFNQSVLATVLFSSKSYRTKKGKLKTAEIICSSKPLNFIDSTSLYTFNNFCSILQNFILLNSKDILLTFYFKKNFLVIKINKFSSMFDIKKIGSRSRKLNHTLVEDAIVLKIQPTLKNSMNDPLSSFLIFKDAFYKFLSYNNLTNLVEENELSED